MRFADIDNKDWRIFQKKINNIHKRYKEEGGCYAKEVWDLYDAVIKKVNKLAP